MYKTQFYNQAQYGCVCLNSMTLAIDQVLGYFTEKNAIYLLDCTQILGAFNINPGFPVFPLCLFLFFYKAGGRCVYDWQVLCNNCVCSRG